MKSSRLEFRIISTPGIAAEVVPPPLSANGTNAKTQIAGTSVTSSPGSASRVYFRPSDDILCLVRYSVSVILDSATWHDNTVGRPAEREGGRGAAIPT